MDNSDRWFLFFVFALLAVALTPAPSYASVTIETSKVGSAGYTPNGKVYNSFTFASGGANTPSNYTKAKPVIPSGAIKTLGKGLIRGGVAGVAVQGVISGLGSGVDYLIENGELQKKENVMSGGELYAEHTPYSAMDLEYYVQACIDKHDSCYTVPEGDNTKIFYGGSEQEEIIDLDPSDWQEVDNGFESASPSTKSTIINNYVQNIASPSGTLDAPSLPAPEDATKQGLQEILDGMPYSLSHSQDLDELFSAYPSLKQSMETVANVKLAQGVASMHSELELTPEQQSMLDNSETSEPTEDEGLDLSEPESYPANPGADWNVKEYGPDDFNVQDVDVGSDTCPAPYQIELVGMLPTVEITFDYICEFADYVHWFFVAGAWILAGTIVVRD